jgi:hypothetical protein
MRQQKTEQILILKFGFIHVHIADTQHIFFFFFEYERTAFFAENLALIIEFSVKNFKKKL